MSSSLASFKSTIEKLIRRFESDRTHYLSKNYSEAQARVDFITPFFKALGWDVENEQGLVHHEREVVVEAAEDTLGRPDYGFRVSGQTRFFVEAKAPSEELNAAKHIIQAKTYAWNTKQVFLVVLTDFEEFRFYDASIKPDVWRPEEGLLLKLRYSDYIANLEKLWEFSKIRVLAGSLEAMLPRDRRTQRLRIPVDAAFLDEMTGWREELAKNTYKNNPGLTAKQLNEIVQRLLDRIVFVRIAEDRRVIEKNQLRDAVEEWRARGGKFHIFEWLNDLFHRINEDFNGEIFKPHLSEEIKIDSEVLARVIERLYPPLSPYRFDVIGVELLGSIYERYLGNTIRVTAKRVYVEKKPEIRKAGGVYYTPEYIVAYIVRNTVSKAIEGKTPKQIEKIRIIDPACGSGSFLIGAFQCLIDYYVNYLSEHPREAQGHALFPDIIRDHNGEPRLSVVRKAEILKNNLFGVDIDPLAIEVTMMSLYLKALEGERSQLPPKQHLLPELKDNIVCGNSLIGRDIYDQGVLFGDSQRDRINAFDWSSDVEGFGKIMREGGFGCVIGNPPYIRIQDLAEWAPEEAEYYKKQFVSAQQGNFDIYIVFLEKGLSILAKDGLLGFIVPRKFMQAGYGRSIRTLLTSGKHVKSIANFSNNQVFQSSFVNTCVLIVSKKPTKELEHVLVPKLASGLGLDSVLKSLPSRFNDLASTALLQSSSIGCGPWILASRAHLALLDKLKKSNSTLKQVTHRIFQGLKTGADKIYAVEARRVFKDGVDVFSKHTGKVHRLEKELLKTLIKGGDSDRFCIKPTKLLILFPYQQTRSGAVQLVAERHLRETLPLTHDYLQEVKSYLERRESGITKGSDWYSYTRSQNIDVIGLPKIITPDLAERSSFSYDGRGEIFFTGGAAGGYGILANEDIDPIYLLGLLNSAVVNWFVQTSGTQMESGYYSYEARFIRSAPIRLIEKSDKVNKGLHDHMVALVVRMLDLNKQKYSGKYAPSEVGRLEREIAATDNEIDDLVFTLYSITNEERRIIEGSAGE